MYVILTVYKKYLYKNCNLHCSLYVFYKNSDLDFSSRCIKPPAHHYRGGIITTLRLYGSF